MIALIELKQGDVIVPDLIADLTSSTPSYIGIVIEATSKQVRVFWSKAGIEKPLIEKMTIGFQLDSIYYHKL